MKRALSLLTLLAVAGSCSRSRDSGGYSWCREVAPQPHEKFRWVWTRTPSDAWAVAMTEILRWNGSAWSDQHSDEDQVLEVIKGTGPEEVWAVGKDEGVPLVLHWNGSAWSEDHKTKFSGTMTDIWSDGHGEVWAVAEGYPKTAEKNGAVLHRTADGWKLMGVVPSPLHGVWGSGANDVWTVGDGGSIHHWNGRELAPVAAATRASLRRVWGSGPADVWAVGDEGEATRWNGLSFAIIPTGVKEPLLAVDGTSPSDVWIVGHGGVALHWTGSAFERVPSAPAAIARCESSASPERVEPDFVAVSVARGAAVRFITASGAMLRYR